MTTLKDRLHNLFENKNTKSYIRLVKSREDLFLEIENYQKTINAPSLMETIWCIMHDTIPPSCECGTTRLFNTFNLGYRNYCGKKCVARWKDHSTKIKSVWKDEVKLENMIQTRKNSCIKKYGVENPIFLDEIKEKIKNTNLQNYGTESVLGSEIVKEKIKKTNLQKYGVQYSVQSEEVKKKINQTFKNNNPHAKDKMEVARKAFIKKHGSNPFALEVIKEKLRKTRQEKFGYVHALQKHLTQDVIDILESKSKFMDTLQNLTLAEAGEKLGVDPTTIARRALTYNCRNIFSISSRSKWEFKIKNFLIQNNLIEGIDFIQGDRTILDGKELDFYFPKINSAIEVGSIFWHSEINAGRKSKYHYDKWKKCKNKGIHLYQYWDTELQDSWNVISSKILYLFKKPLVTVGARKINEFRTISVKEEQKFLSRYHIQGYTHDRQKSFGAYINNQLVGLISVANRNRGIEVVRYATDLNASYPGLFSKILKFALLQLGVKKTTVLSFSDNRHSSGNMYMKSGFKIKHHVYPNYYYTKNYHSLENKKKYTKQKISKKFNVDISNKTEWQLMQELNYDRIWDAGKILWAMEVEY